MSSNKRRASLRLSSKLNTLSSFESNKPTVSKAFSSTSIAKLKRSENDVIVTFSEASSTPPLTSESPMADKENVKTFLSERKFAPRTILRTPRRVSLSIDNQVGKEVNFEVPSTNRRNRRISFSSHVRRAQIKVKSPHCKIDTPEKPMDSSYMELSPEPMNTICDVDNSNKPFRQLSSPVPTKQEESKKGPFGLSSGSRIEIAPHVKSVYRTINRFTGSIGGNGSGGAIYGELSIGSMQKVVNLLKVHTNLSSSSRFIDVGCGLGKPNIHVAQDPGVEFSYGLEMESIRWVLALSNLNQVLKSAKKNKQIGHKCFLACANINEAKTLDPFTHVYMFDIGFPPWQQERIAQMFNRSKSPYFICYHPPRLIIDKYGYNVEFITKMPTSMHGSSEGHTCYVYTRVGYKPEADKSSRKPPCDELFRDAWNLTQKGLEPLSTYVENTLQAVLHAEAGPRTRRSARNATN